MHSGPLSIQSVQKCCSLEQWFSNGGALRHSRVREIKKYPFLIIKLGVNG